MTRPLLVAIGAAVLALAWSGAAAAVAPGPFAAHMAVHIAVVAVAAPLLAAGLTGGRGDPAARLPRLFSPLPASLAELALVWAWHTPVLHHAARASSPAYVAEQGSFLAAGLLLWLSAAGGTAGRGAAGVAALLLTSMHMTLLGALFALAPRVLYGAHGEGAAALADQHLGGVVMLLVGGGSYLLGGLWLTGRVLHDRLTGAEALP